jgi:AcrR family transcriptional regulator
MQEGICVATSDLDGPGREAALPLPPWRASVQRRAKRGQAPQLDRDRIVARALEIVDAAGIDGLSLRRLADDLGVTPMSLYWHVADKAELLELVGRAVLAEIVVPDRAGDWKDQLRDIHRAMLAAFLRHPNATDILPGRARFGSGGLAAFERILEVLLGAGFSAEAAYDAYGSLYLFTLGFMATCSRTPAFLEAQRQGWEYMLTLPVEQFPAIRAVTAVVGQRSTADRFELGLDVVVEGIAARLAGERAG